MILDSKNLRERDHILVAVNGTLMRGFELNSSMLALEGRFIAEAKTAPIYRMWTINDQYPAMIRDNHRGADITLELWEVPNNRLVTLLENEPPGLVLGWIILENGQNVLGILGEPYLIDQGLEITHFHGWREYLRYSRLDE